MKSASAVREATEKNDWQALEEFLGLNPDFARAATRGTVGRWPSENPAWLSLEHVQTEVNLRLGRYVSIELQRDPKVPEAKLYLSPSNLLGAIWLQFGLAVEGHKEFRKCAQCGEPFEVSVDASGKRTDARFCRSVCRVTNYRERVAMALKLHAQGVRPKEIAKQLETDAETVRNWVSKGVHDGQKARKK